MGFFHHVKINLCLALNAFPYEITFVDIFLEVIAVVVAVIAIVATLSMVWNDRHSSVLCAHVLRGVAWCVPCLCESFIMIKLNLLGQFLQSQNRLPKINAFLCVRMKVRGRERANDI